MFRRGGFGGRSKASADTLCQKCLKRGHYSYECTVSAQERPYKSRPSRTQQLLNPKLKPKLTEDVPNDLLRKKGVADAILAQKEKERGRSPGRDSSRKRSRSISSYSSGSDSVSTISTNRSPSRSRSPPKRIENGRSSLRGGDKLGKRPRRSVSSASDSAQETADRNTRRRMSSFSPAERGRRRTRSRSSRMDISHDNGSRRGGARKYRSRSRSFSRGRRSRSRSKDGYGKRPARRFSPSRSPSGSPNRMDTSEDRNASHNGEFAAMNEIHRRFSPRRRRLSRSRTRSRSPYTRRRAPKSPSPFRSRNGEGHPGRKYQFTAKPPARDVLPAAQPPPPRDRSLSPYSKRVAMTRAMQAGR